VVIASRERARDPGWYATHASPDVEVQVGRRSSAPRHRPSKAGASEALGPMWGSMRVRATSRRRAEDSRGRAEAGRVGARGRGHHGASEAIAGRAGDRSGAGARRVVGAGLRRTTPWRSTRGAPIAALARRRDPRRGRRRLECRRHRDRRGRKRRSDRFAAARPPELLIYNAGSGAWGNVTRSRRAVQSSWRVNAFGAFSARRSARRDDLAGRGAMLFTGRRQA